MGTVVICGIPLLYLAIYRIINNKGISKISSYFASQAGITTVKAELLPEEKVDSIIQMQKVGRNVCMIGEGVNDAPALKKKQL